MAEFGDDGFWDQGPYPEDWNQPQRDFWDAEPNTYHGYYDEPEWESLQEAFHFGWIETGMSKEDHEAWREEYYELSGTTEDSFDWEAFHDYLAEIGS